MKDIGGGLVKTMVMENHRNYIIQYNITIEVVYIFILNSSHQHLFTTMAGIVVVVTILVEDMVGVAIDAD